MSGSGATRGSYPLLQRGMPFFAFMVGGSYGVSILLQGRNDVRDAKADVTDMRAPSKTQNVRRKNNAFDIDAERERTIQELGGLEKPDVVDMVPVPRPWEEPGAQRRRWWKKVKRWWGGQA